MRVLVITARFPPPDSGGYQIRSKDVTGGLARKGHEVLVITTQEVTAYRPPRQATAYKVLRTLHPRTAKGFISQLTEWRSTHFVGMLLTFARELLLDLQDLAFVDRQSRQFRPDVIYVGHVGFLSKSIMPYLAEQRVPVVYDEGGTGLVDSWEDKAIWYKFVAEYVSRLPVINAMKPFIVKLVCSASANRLKPQWVWPDNMHIFFNDELGMRNAIARGVPVNGAKVIRSGVDTERFRFRSRSSLSTPVKFIVPGRIEPRKGQMDGIRLLAELREHGVAARMVFVGSVWSDSYCKELADEVEKLRLEDNVSISPVVAQDELAALYQKADICFFPSYHRTGFSRVPLEAMATGCVLISYGNEGSDEIIRDGDNGLLVPPADFEAISGVVEELMSNPEKVSAIAETARYEIEREFSLDKYVDRIEQLIKGAVGMPHA
jgi:glycosyltransferase involved in cell wall biosynthesis